MIELTPPEIAEAVHGQLTATVDSQQPVCAATTDSREVTEGTLFIAKPGEVADGHSYIPAARGAGASLILAQRETFDKDGRPDPAVIVEDTVTAMGQLAAYIVQRIREHSDTTVIGITGSAGKTTTKDALAALLATQGPTVAPYGSYNGEVGVPLTVFRAELDTKYLIVEMGADQVGNIAELCDMVQPDIGVVLMVGTAHTSSFGSVHNIAATKGELVEALPPHGLALLNAEDPAVAAMAERVHRAQGEAAKVGWFSHSTPPETMLQQAPLIMQADQMTTDELGHPTFRLVLHKTNDDGSYAQQTSQMIVSGLVGEHHVTNLSAAAAVAQAVGMDLDEIATVLNGLGPASAHRMARTERQDGIMIIDDAYNANPESMRAGLKTLAMMGRATGRRTWAVLGEMLELGEAHAREHIQIGEAVVRLNIDQLLVVGSGARALYTGAVMEGSWGDEAEFVETNDAAYELLMKRLSTGDIVFLKGSHSTGMWKLADMLTSTEPQEADK